MADVDMVTTSINGRWHLKLPRHRAERPHWGKWTNAEGESYFGWEVERLKSMNRNIKPGDLVFDVGTEEGDLSALYATWGARLVLFEPNPKAWPNIRTIFEANDLPRPLYCYEGFVSNEGNDLGKSLWATWPEVSTGEVIGDHGFCNLSERPDLARTTLDHFVSILGCVPDFITIDVEGSEFRVLQGAENTLREHRPLVYVSIHESFMFQMYDESPVKIFNLMGRLGYDHHFLEYDHELHVAFHHPQGRSPWFR